MAASERDKMVAGGWYTCLDPELEAMRVRARAAVHRHNTMSPVERGAMAHELASLFGSVGEDTFLEAPFHCAYGINIHLGTGVYLNAGCVVLDTAPVRIGKRSMLGPAVQIYCAEHHKDPVLRGQGLEIARPVILGENVWIGGAAVILGGVTIGDGAIVGAGSVVTRAVAPGERVAGNPARPITKP